MRLRLVHGIALGLLCCAAPGVMAQAPAIPGAGGAAAGAGGAGGAAGGAGGLGAAGAAAPPAAAPMNLLSLLPPTAAQKKQIQKKLCGSALGSLLKTLTGPLSLYSGGLLGNTHCPADEEANQENLEKPPDSAEGAEARIKKSEAEAKARRASVRYLGTVDCERYPEAEDALINALRADTNECVRFEAALALGRGCCCTRKTIAALTLTVSASRKDGNPRERSPRVRAAAAVALQNCLHSYCEIEPIDPALLERPEAPTPPETPEDDTGAAPGPQARGGDAEARLLAQARVALSRHQGNPQRLKPLATSPPPVAHTPLPARPGRDLTSIFRRAVTPTAHPVPAPRPQARAPDGGPARAAYHAPARTAGRVPLPATPYATLRPTAPGQGQPAPRTTGGLPPTGQRGLFNLLRHSTQSADW